MTVDAYPSILADSDTTVVKLVIGVIVLIVWAIVALLKLAVKSTQRSPAEQAERERQVRAHWEEVRRREAIAQALHQSGQHGQPYPQQMAPPPLPPMPGALQPHPQQPQQRPRGPMVPPMRTLPPVPQQARPRPAAQPAPRAPLRPPQQQQRQQPKQRKQQRRVQPAPVAAVELEELPARSAQTPSDFESELSQAGAPTSSARRQAQRGPVVRLTPQTLRQQFILTEILQPPLALRDHPHD